MKLITEKKYVHVPLSIEYYIKLQHIADFERRSLCGQAAQLIKRAINEYSEIPNVE